LINLIILFYLLFIGIDDHGVFSEFYQIKSHTNKEQVKEIITLIQSNRNVTFDTKLIDNILTLTDGFVFKDIEKLIDKIIFTNYIDASSSSSLNNQTVINLNESNQEIIYNYVSINLIETKLYKSQTQINWNLIGGCEQTKSQLTELLIWPIKYKYLYSQLKMKQSGGVLIYGPSGCGKTLVASALANESKFNFISVKGPELLSKYIGNSEQNVRELFKKAEKAKPCIIFFDEFDALAPKRGHDSTGVTDRVVNQLLVQLDGVEQCEGVYILAATSRPDLIDQALLRPGRLDQSLYIGYPNRNEIEQIFKIYTNEMNLEEDYFDKLSSLCVDLMLSGADIKSIVCDAYLKAFHRVTLPINNNNNDDENLRSLIKVKYSDFETSINEMKRTINRNERIKLNLFYQNWMLKNDDNTEQQQQQKGSRVTLA